MIATVGQAKDVTLHWDPSPTPTVTGYTLYWSTHPTIPHDNRIEVDCGMTLNQFVADLPNNQQHWFAVTAHDNIGNESTYSNIVMSPEVSDLPVLNFMIEWKIIP